MSNTVVKLTALSIALCWFCAGSQTLAANKSSPRPSLQKAESLYEAGKFTQAESVYQDLLTPDLSSSRGRLEAIAKELLGIARAQAAQGKWPEAEKNFNSALGLAKGIGMPRNFIDTVRGGLAEAQAKTGSTFEAAAPTVKVSPPAIPPSLRFRSSGVTIETIPSYHFQSLKDALGMQTQDPNELRYLLTCSLHYAEQKSGVNSYEAATRHLALANLLVNVGDAEAASESIKRSAAILPKLVPAQQTSLSGNMLDLASRLADQDKLQLATFLTDPVAKVTAPNLSAAQQLSSKYVRLSNTFLNRGSAEKAESYAKQAVSLLEKIASPNDPQLAQARLNLASLFEKQNKVGTAIEMHEMALTTPAGDDDTSIKATCSLIGLYAKSGNKAKMNEFSNKLLTALASPSPPNDRQWYPPCAELTGLLIQYGESEAGRKVFAAALNRLSSEPGNSSYEITSATAKLLRQLESAGKIDEAEKIHLMRIAKRNETAVFDDAAISAYSEMCRFYLKHQMDEKAKTTCDTLIEKIRKSQPNPRMLSSLCSLANSFISHQRYPGALPVALLAVELANANQTKDSQTIEAYTRAAIAYNGMGDTANAKLMLLKGVSLITPRLAPEFSTVGSSWEKLVAAQVDAGKVDESANLLSLVGAQALSSRQRTPSNSYALNTYRSLGTAADSAKVPDLACIYFKRALDIEGESSGPCSLQSANIMRSYSNSLRNAGKIKEAQSFEDAAVVIRDQYVRHIRGERNVYNPHRSLEELLKDAHLKKYRPDSST